MFQFVRHIARFAGGGYKFIFFKDLDDFAKGYQQAYQQKTGITLRIPGAVGHERCGSRRRWCVSHGAAGEPMPRRTARHRARARGQMPSSQIGSAGAKKVISARMFH
jgi:hypothetical protein